MGLPWLEAPLARRLEQWLDVTAFRHNVIVANMANVDTPGYKTQDVDFRAALASAMGGELPGLQTVAAHPAAREVKGLVERPDGNNVSLERESLLLAENQLQYRIGIALLRGQMRQIQSAINEGR
jgi:flagellar basal-body rod protein FlgB